MKKWMVMGCLVFLWTHIVGFGQEIDPDIAEIMNKVEGKKKEPVVAHYIPKNETETQVFEASKKYLEACSTSDWKVAYEFTWKKYKEKVLLGSYRSKRRSKIRNFRILKIDIDSETCARVEASFDVSSQFGPLKGIKSNQRWFLEEGNWVLVLNPYEAALGIPNPHRKKIKYPCGYKINKP